MKYAVDRIGIWHIAASVSDVSPEAIGICGYRFKLAARVSESRPRNDAICSGCLFREQQRTTTPTSRTGEQT